MDSQSFRCEEPEHVSMQLRLHDIENEQSAGRFIGFLCCDNAFCKEFVAVSGNYSAEFHHDYDPESNSPVVHESTDYRPTSMTPAPKIIEYPKGLNKDSKDHLLRAFALFWADHASCANRLRIVVEYVLDQLSIPREGPKGTRKKARLDLADRIDQLKVAKPGHDDALNALRFVGNVGSHEGVVDFEDLLTCFEVLEDVMIELIEGRRDKLNQRIQEINGRKGKPKP